jgi:class 3 adenylate cyclase
VEPSNVQRRLTCILAADAVGYSEQMGRDEEGTIRVLSAHRAVIDGIIAFHQGRIVSTAGDSVLAEFASVVEAVRCAVEVQEALKTRNDSLPDNRKMHFRVGVNLGDVVVKNDDLLGDGVNVAARLETMAEPGGICISSSVYDQITGKLDLGFQDIGNQNLKNISRPIHVYRVSGAAPPLRIAPATPAKTVAPAARSQARWAIGAVLALLIGAAIAWQSGWVRFGSGDNAAKVVATAPVAAPPPLPAVEKTIPPDAVPAANVARAQVESEVQRLRSDAEAMKRQAEAELARARAETAAARTKRETETASRTAVAPVARSSPPPPPKPIEAAPAVSAPVVLAAEKTIPPAAIGAAAFDGTWNVTVECYRHADGALGYTLEFIARVKNGFLSGEKGADGEAGSLKLEGNIPPDGNATLSAKGRTGDPRFNAKNVRSGAPYAYDVIARFDGARGSGHRVQLRKCDLTFVKQ